MANLGEIMFVQGVSFSNDAILSAAGQAAIVMRPGSLSGPYTTRARNFAFALGESTILIQGGEIDAGNLISPNFGTAEKATWMAGEGVQIFGGNGYINDYPLGRLWRDAKLYEIGAGTSEIRRMLIGRELFAETM